MRRENMISVVIPVYNTEQYLKECIESVIHQTYKEIEIILIDDGSTDSSGNICDEYAKVDNRITVIHQENKGLVGATNTGISVATGDYIAFVDSDDWIDDNMYEFMINTIGECDIISTEMICEYYDSADSQIFKPRLPEGNYIDVEQVNAVLKSLIGCQKENNRGISCSRCVHLFRKSIVDQIYMERNPKIIYGEDRLFVFSYLLKCNSIKITHNAFYHYRMRSGSCTHSVDKGFLSNISDYYVAMEQLCEKHPAKDFLIAQLEEEIVEQIEYAIDYRLGFQHYRNIKYKIPFEIEQFKGKKLILYAAGRVGKDYYYQLEKSKLLADIKWIDRDYEQYQEQNVKIVAPESILDTEFDVTLIAVKREGLAMDIKKSLIEMKMDADKILWKEPIQIR